LIVGYGDAEGIGSLWHGKLILPRGQSLGKLTQKNHRYPATFRRTSRSGTARRGGG
jgi:hypothetical protein